MTPPCDDRPGARLRRVAAPEADVALHGVAASRAIEAAAQAVLPPHTLMRRAGAAVAALALALAPHARRVWIAAGPGNNGGDGFEAALALAAAGKAVAVSFAGDPARVPPDAADAHARARAAGVAIDVVPTQAGAFAPPPLGPDDLAIDALLGLGVARAAEGAIALLIDALNGIACPVLAVDLPSGLDAWSGQPVGTRASGASDASGNDRASNVLPPRCVRAAHTLALLTLKPGLYTGAGRDLAGAVWFDDLGVAPAVPADAWLVGTAHARSAQGERRHAQHKGSFGDVAVVGGAPGMTGAALLAARAAHAAGAGRVWISLLDTSPGALSIDPTRPELMWRREWWLGDATALRAATVVCGCGGGQSVTAALPRLLDEAQRLVLDADALNAVAADAVLRARLAARAGRGQATVLTPHPLEAARLLGVTTAAVQADRLGSAQALALRDGCVVVLKGSGSVIAAPGRAPFVNPTGNAALATAGTGDVLAGWLGGVWARQAVPGDPVEAALAAVHTHGAVADRSQVAPLRAANLVDAMMERA